MKTVAGNGTVSYRIAPSGLSIVSGYQELVHHVAHNDALVIVQTRTGSANHVAQYIDEQDWPEMIGTLAGDNCIFIAPASAQTIPALVKRIKTQFALD